jgi:hypothetical protein
MFTPRAPRKRSGGSPTGPIVAVVVVAVLGAGGYWWMTRPVEVKLAPVAAADAAAPAYPGDVDGFRAATEGEVAAYEAAMAPLGLGDALDAAKARADVDGYRGKVSKSQVLVGFHRNKVVGNVRNARLNANRRAGGGPAGEAAMTAFDSSHADALARINERWTLEAKVAEERGMVMQTLAYDPDNGQRLGSDLAELRGAEAKLKAFKASQG